MRIYIKVIPRSSQRKIEKISEGDFKAWVRSVPEKGKANIEVRELVAEYFSVNKNQTEIIGGKTSSRKIIEVEKDS